jgi:hypothetical protein
MREAARMSEGTEPAGKPKRRLGLGVALLVAAGVAICSLILLAVIIGIANGHWSALFSDSGILTDLVIPSVVFLVVLAVTWRKGGWLRVREAYGLKAGYLDVRYRHYEDAIRSESWARTKASRAEAADPGSAKSEKLAESAREATADLRQRRQQLRDLKQDLCDAFPDDAGLAKRLDAEFPVPDEPSMPEVSQAAPEAPKALS